MKAIQILNAGGKAVVNQVPLPKREEHEVMVKPLFAPIHPFDVFGYREKFPWTLGIEGSGIIVEAKNKNLLGKRCAFYKFNGTWAEYVIPTNYTLVPDDLSSEAASLLTINPVSALALYKLTLGQRFILSGANSSLGLMLLRIAKDQKPICIVRNLESRQEVMMQGVQHVIEINRGSFLEYLALCVKDHPVYLGFDLVAGKMTSTMLKYLGKGGVLHIVGHLSNKGIDTLDYKDFVYLDKSLKCFGFKHYEGRVQEFYKEILMEPGIFKTKVQKVVEFEEFLDGQAEYLRNMRNGKVLLRFG